MSASETISDTLDLLVKREAHLDRLINKEIDGARDHNAGNRKRQALECMKRKRIYESEREQLSVQKMNLLQQEQTLNQVRFTTSVVNASQVAAAAIEREVAKVKGPEGVEKVQDRLDDAIADAGDVVGAASRPMGELANVDDEELMDELDELELAAMKQELTDVSDSVVPAPVPRTTNFPSPAVPAPRREEEELEALEQSMKAVAVEKPMPLPMMAAPMPLHTTLKIEHPMAMPMTCC